LASHTPEDAFREIQLNGKQLVFVFMAATVVSVVIFLCGVLVGRGVRAERNALTADATAASDVAVAETTPQRTTQPPAAIAAGSDPTTAAPPPPVDDLSYFNRLEKPAQSRDDLKPASAAAKSPPRAAAEPPGPSSRTAKQAASTSGGGAVPAGGSAAAKDTEVTAPGSDASGYAVQVAALNVRGEAEAIAKRLSSKGYSAYVLTPASGTPNVFRVRVGKFGSRREAESVAAKLQKEEQFKPWITR
jgi:cell division septation protein DedD